jgi:hypothetical protein
MPGICRKNCELHQLDILLPVNVQLNHRLICFDYRESDLELSQIS